MSFLVTSSVARQLVPAQSSRYLAAVTSPGACVNTENSPIQTTNMLIKCSILIWSFAVLHCISTTEFRQHI